MPRKTASARSMRHALLSIQVETAQREMRKSRRADRTAQAALALRHANPDWMDLKQQLTRLDLELEMEAMEAQIEARKPRIPILDPTLIAHMRQPASERPSSASPQPNLSDPQYANIKRPALPKGETYAHPGYGDHRHPADDWRNYE